MCTLLWTHTFCLMCHTHKLFLYDNQIGDACLTALAKAVESGALASLESVSLGYDLETRETVESRVGDSPRFLTYSTTSKYSLTVKKGHRQNPETDISISATPSCVTRR